MASCFSFCHVCGYDDMEVKKLHYFPKNLENSKIWQENMGMVFSGQSLQNYKICSRHFEEQCYIGVRLRRNAVPTLFPCIAINSNNNSGTSVFLDLSTENKEIASTASSSASIMFETSFDYALTTPVPKDLSTQKPDDHQSILKGIDNSSRNEKEQCLMKTIKNKEDQIRKLKNLCKSRGRDIKELKKLTDSNVVQNIFKGMSKITTTFLMSQLKCAKVADARGRRWTNEEKVIALAIFKRSPRCYNFLREILAMPSRRTVLGLLEKVPFSVGINIHLFRHINKSLTKEEDRLCVCLFDEMDIKENLMYDKGQDRIIGFEDFGDGGGTKFANKALVFMLQGLALSWKQPIAYYFCNGPCESSVLVKCLKEVLNAALNEGGLDVVGTTCDMGTNNVKAIKLLNSSIEKPFFELNGKQIYTMHDPPHLLKCTVSLFRKYNLYLPVFFNGKEQIMEAKFKDIVQAYEIDKKTPLAFKALYKIRDVHLMPVMRFAMKVCVAAQVMSRSVAAWLYTLLSRGELEQRSIATATFVQQVDELFDSFNGKQLKPGDKKLKCVITKKSAHIKYWEKAKNMVQNWQFKRITKAGTLREAKPPSQIGWIVSLNAIRGIWGYVSKKINILRPRSLNQDGLENLFGNIRGGCGSSDNPTAFQFVGSLKTQILNNLTSQKIIGNCKKDNQHLLTNLQNFLEVEKDEPVPMEVDAVNVDEEKECTLSSEENDLFQNIQESVSEGRSQVLSVAYVSGYIGKRILTKIDCKHCKKMLTSTEMEPHNTFITFKEWTESENKLFYPSDNFVVFVGAAISRLENFLPKYGGKPGVMIAATKDITKTIRFGGYNCPIHEVSIVDAIARAVSAIGIPWWCKRLNRHLNEQKKDIRSTKNKLKKLKHN